ncbi:TraB domain-containing protein [Linum perenne]
MQTPNCSCTTDSMKIDIAFCDFDCTCSEETRRPPVMNRLTRQLPPFHSLRSSRSTTASAATVVTNKLSVRRKHNLPLIYHRFIRFPHKIHPVALYGTRTGNSDSAKVDHAGEEFVKVDNSDPRGSTMSGSIGSVADELRGDREAVSSGRTGGRERGEIPEELSRTVMLTCESTAESGSCNVYLVGTAHVSQDSCREVEAVIRYLKPEVVFVELCSDRKNLLTPQDLKFTLLFERFKHLELPLADMLKVFNRCQHLEKCCRSGNRNITRLEYYIAGFLRRQDRYFCFIQVASKLEVFPGSEFRVASEEAKACGAEVILGDRPVQVTLQRTWRKMPLRHKAKLIYSLCFQAVFLPSPVKLTRMASELQYFIKEMEDVDMLTLVIQEMSKAYPTLMETLVHERDQFRIYIRLWYMASMLHKTASEHSLVVAVVGRGHLEGIKKHWQQPVSMEELLKIPESKPVVSVLKIMTSIGAVAAGVAIVSGIYLLRKK